MAILELKHKCLEMQSGFKEKAASDHYIDVLKLKLDEMQDKNHYLNVEIERQKCIIDES